MEAYQINKILKQDNCEEEVDERQTYVCQHFCKANSRINQKLKRLATSRRVDKSGVKK